MDSVLSHETLTYWLLHYGSITLFILLALGIVAFPIPEETLMVFTGILMSSGKLPIPPTILAALGGSLCGITISYLLGRTAGSFMIHKYGSWMGITEERLQKTHAWFEHYGKWSLFVGYFIPGVRHFTGLVAGTTALSFDQFMLFAYTGGFFWVTTFLSLGYFAGDSIIALQKNFAALELGADWASLGLIALFLLCIGCLAIWRFCKNRRQ